MQSGTTLRRSFQFSLFNRVSECPPVEAECGVFLADYPNLPLWLTRPRVYGAWLVVTALGVFGYLLARARYPRVGLGVLAVYAALGLDGLAHYTRAPFTAHTGAMNFTILFEVIAAILVLAAIVLRSF